ncbi:hypothetical protein D3273_21225 [Lichenibacterium minor]|uniref:Uncharacterized protein n=1 Tax=Lichenibacterium minor TaxID=2316528 RepID=A0A4Q2U4S5_9HYPH|nr:hypothetical protein [Lichenibacterium minor]RYC29981.1 hypothetical protein D3273_21225 [Lichenibacterium minor]
MAVNLNVVGIFLSKPIDVGGASKTVKQVMDLAMQQLSDPIFRYTAIESSQIVNSMLAYYPNGFTSRSGRKYVPGVYRLGQTFTNPTPNPYTVWQYYLFDKNNVRIPVPGETSYTKTVVDDGSKIVWRLVTICNAPTGLSRRMDGILPPDTLPLDMF